ncbi:MAG: DUF2207 domain-containing protein [Candidatus Berkelbacteria bacterium]|nr:DUF2207 domain-containing protein [Candidatus Berkelbacteria bacterium]
MRGEKRQPTIEIAWRKLAFFAFLFVFGFVGWKVFSGSRYMADVSSDQTAAGILNVSEINLVINKDGSVTKDGQKISTKISPQRNFDELRMVVYDQNGFYLDSLRVNLKLPVAAAQTTKSEILAIHGTGAADSFVVDDSTIAYDADSVSPASTVTIVAQLPKGVIQLSFYDETIYLISTFGKSVWLILAIAIPFIALAYLFLLISLRRKSQKIVLPDRAISAPPAALPPAAVGVLLKQDIGAREIAATLIDLSLRKFIYIIDRDRGFSFGKRDFSGQLIGFEKILLSKIFRQNLSSNETEVSERFANHLYSRKMSLFSREIYALSTRLGYFKENPSKMHNRYRFIGILFFVFAIACFFVTLSYFSSVPYAAFFWVGMMAVSLIIIFVGGAMPIRTALGRQAMTNWLAFRKYLSDPRPLSYDQKNFSKFVEYLPYAIIFQVEALWARRFVDQEFIIPDWFLTEREGLGLNDFCLALYPIVSYVSQNLANITEPEYK